MSTLMTCFLIYIILSIVTPITIVILRYFSIIGMDEEDFVPILFIAAIFPPIIYLIYFICILQNINNKLTKNK